MNLQQKLIYLDTETTGLDEEDRLCQVAFKYQDKISDELFKPPLPIKIESMSITHITNKMVANKPPFNNSEMHKSLATAFAEGAILVAHNAPFDIKMLEKEGLKVGQYICTKKIAQYLDEKAVIPSYRLQYLRYLLDIEIEATAHDALGDILVLEKLFEKLLVKMIKKEGNEESAINKMIEISAKPILIKKFNFGKFKDRFVEEADRGYLEWLLREKKNNEADDVDWIHTLEFHLGK